MIRLKQILLSSLLLVVASSRLPAADPPPQKINLEHADTLRSRGESRELIGSVRVSRGATVIESDRALYEPEQARIILMGNVRLTDPDRTLRAGRVRFLERTGDFEANDVQEMTAGDSVRIRCRNARYFDRTKTAELEDDVVIDLLSDGSRITGGFGRFRTSDSSGFIEERPIYRLPDKPDSSDVPPDTLVIVSDRLEFSRRDRSARFSGEVKLTKGEIIAAADTLFHQPDSGSSRLSGAPVIWRGREELAGDLILLEYAGRDLKKIIARGRATALTPSNEQDSRLNKLSGERLTLETTSDSSRVVTAEGDAEGWYFVWDAKEGYQGVNVAAADRIRLEVIGERTDKISLEGKTSGAFYPPGSEPSEIAPPPRKMDGIGWGEL